MKKETIIGILAISLPCFGVGRLFGDEVIINKQKRLIKSQDEIIKEQGEIIEKYQEVIVRLMDERNKD